MKKNRKICFVVGAFPQPTETFVINQIIGAINAGYEVNVLTHRLAREGVSTQIDLLQEYNLFDRISVVKYSTGKNVFVRFWKTLYYLLVYIKYIVKPRKMSLKNRLLRLPFKLHFYNQFRQIDCFHIQFGVFAHDIADMKLYGLLKSNMVVTFHGYDAHFKDELLKNQLRVKYKTVFTMADHVTVNTLFLHDKLIQLNCEKSKLKVIPMGVNVDFFKNTLKRDILPNERINLISVGRLIPFKGHEYGIEVIKVLKEKGYKVHYTIIGSGGLKEYLEQKIIDLNLQKEITLAGKRSQNEIKHYFEGNHIFLMTSVPDNELREETQGVVTAEAQASGLPVVGFNSGGVPFTLIDGETGYLTALYDVDTFAQNVAYLIDNPTLYREVSNKARIFAEENFSIEQMITSFTKLYG